MDGTDYVVRKIEQRPLLAHRYTVVDRHGRLHHVHVTDQAAHNGMTDTLIRLAIARAPQPKVYPS